MSCQAILELRLAQHSSALFITPTHMLPWKAPHHLLGDAACAAAVTLREVAPQALVHVGAAQHQQEAALAPQPGDQLGEGDHLHHARLQQQQPQPISAGFMCWLSCCAVNNEECPCSHEETCHVCACKRESAWIGQKRFKMWTAEHLHTCIPA
jgi:hypothetical protein